MEAGPEEVNLVVLSLVPTIGVHLVGNMDVTSVARSITKRSNAQMQSPVKSKATTVKRSLRLRYQHHKSCLLAKAQCLANFKSTEGTDHNGRAHEDASEEMAGQQRMAIRSDSLDRSLDRVELESDFKSLQVEDVGISDPRRVCGISAVSRVPQSSPLRKSKQMGYGFHSPLESSSGIKDAPNGSEVRKGKQRASASDSLRISDNGIDGTFTGRDADLDRELKSHLIDGELDPTLRGLKGVLPECSFSALGIPARLRSNRS